MHRIKMTTGMYIYIYIHILTYLMKLSRAREMANFGAAKPHEKLPSLNTHIRYAWEYYWTTSGLQSINVGTTIISGTHVNCMNHSSELQKMDDGHPIFKMFWMSL